jgi:cell division protein FtsZ
LGLGGLGVGSNFEMGRMAAEYSADDIQNIIKDADILIIISCFGGGTGTGASPFIANLAKKMGKLIIGIIANPFIFEGLQKTKIAEEGLQQFKKEADTTIEISNNNLFTVTNSSTPLCEAYLVLDQVSIKLVISLFSMLKLASVMNLDFADFKKATQNIDGGGIGLVGFGEGIGTNCCEDAVQMALSMPLLTPINHSKEGLYGARHILIHIIVEGGTLTLSKLENIVTCLTKGMDKNAFLKIGVTEITPKDKSNNNSFLDLNEIHEQKIKVTFIATGFQKTDMSAEAKLNINDPHEIILEHDFNFDENTSFLNGSYKKTTTFEDLNKKEGEEEEDLIQKTKLNTNEKKKPFTMSFLEAIKNRFNL